MYPVQGGPNAPGMHKYKVRQGHLQIQGAQWASKGEHSVQQGNVQLQGAQSNHLNAQAKMKRVVQSIKSNQDGPFGAIPRVLTGQAWSKDA